MQECAEKSPWGLIGQATDGVSEGCGSRKEECETGFPSSDSEDKNNNEQISPFETKVKVSVSWVRRLRSRVRVR